MLSRSDGRHANLQFGDGLCALLHQYVCLFLRRVRRYGATLLQRQHLHGRPVQGLSRELPVVGRMRAIQREQSSPKLRFSRSAMIGWK
jgi:hypothetical protein